MSITCRRKSREFRTASSACFRGMLALRAVGGDRVLIEDRCLVAFGGIEAAIQASCERPRKRHELFNSAITAVPVRWRKLPRKTPSVGRSTTVLWPDAPVSCVGLRTLSPARCGASLLFTNEDGLQGLGATDHCCRPQPQSATAGEAGVPRRQMVVKLRGARPVRLPRHLRMS
jgi:hypothetical protein